MATPNVISFPIKTTIVAIKENFITNPLYTNKYKRPSKVEVRRDQAQAKEPYMMWGRAGLGMGLNGSHPMSVCFSITH